MEIDFDAFENTLNNHQTIKEKNKVKSRIVCIVSSEKRETWHNKGVANVLINKQIILPIFKLRHS